MKVTILGCGPSYGVPSLTRGFDAVDPKEKKNIRDYLPRPVSGKQMPESMRPWTAPRGKTTAVQPPDPVPLSFDEGQECLHLQHLAPYIY